MILGLLEESNKQELSSFCSNFVSVKLSLQLFFISLIIKHHCLRSLSIDLHSHLYKLIVLCSYLNPFQVGWAGFILPPTNIIYTVNIYNLCAMSTKKIYYNLLVLTLNFIFIKSLSILNRLDKNTTILTGCLSLSLSLYIYIYNQVTSNVM